jgi:hypothetical protein
MKVICLITGIVFWTGACLDPKLGRYIYLIWAIAFLLTWCGWSILFSILCLIASFSFSCMSLDSSNFIRSSVFPWVFSISLTIIILSLNIKYFSQSGLDKDGGNTGGFDGDLGDDL